MEVVHLFIYSFMTHTFIGSLAHSRIGGWCLREIEHKLHPQLRRVRERVW